VLLKNYFFRKNNKSFKDYGGRGICIDEAWLDFRQFLFDMGERPPNTQLDRIDNNKGSNKVIEQDHKFSNENLNNTNI
jgi:hypothetical protein